MNSIEAAHPFSQPKPYRAEYNALSGRWMIIDANEVCQSAGLSESKAKDTANALNDQSLAA